MKYLIFDSGALINFASNSLLSILEKLKKSFPGEFLITETVKYETIEHPINVKRFEWGALRIQQLLNNKTIRLAEEVVDKETLKNKTDHIIESANNSFFAKGRSLHLLDRGESECIALYQILKEQNHSCAIVIDERTARVLCEKPKNMQKLFEKKLHTKIRIDEGRIRELKDCRIIRSTELAYLAYKKGFIIKTNKKTLEAVIYALKFGGSSISEKEAITYSKMG